MKTPIKDDIFKLTADKAFKKYSFIGETDGKLHYRKSNNTYQGNAIFTRTIFGLREGFSIEQTDGKIKIKNRFLTNVLVYLVVYSLVCIFLSVRYSNDSTSIIIVFSIGFSIHALIASFISSSFRQELKTKYLNYYRAYKKNLIQIGNAKSPYTSEIKDTFEATNVRFKYDRIELMRNKFVYKTIKYWNIEKLIVKNGMLLKNVGIVRVLCIAIIFSMLILIREAISTPYSGGIDALVGVNSFRSLAYMLMGPFALIILSLIVIYQTFISSTLIEIHSENNVKMVRIKVLDRRGETEEFLEVLSGKVKLEDKRQ